MSELRTAMFVNTGTEPSTGASMLTIEEGVRTGGGGGLGRSGGWLGVVRTDERSMSQRRDEGEDLFHRGRPCLKLEVKPGEVVAYADRSILPAVQTKYTGR